MKFLSLLLLPLTGLFAAGKVSAQITINSSDMPQANVGYQYTNILNLQQVNLQQTGANQTWNYSSLTASTQATDSFISFASLPPTIKLVFFNSGNLALDASIPGLDSLPLPIPIPNSGTLIINNTSSGYTTTGFAFDFNGFPLPVKYADPDEVYKFPLEFQGKDSSTGFFNISLPGLGYYEQSLVRKVQVDGYGTLITPADTYEVLRVKTMVLREDSIHLDTLGQGFRTPPQLEVTYAWLAKGSGIAVLSVSGRMVAGNFLPTSGYFLGKPGQGNPSGIETSNSINEGIKIYPNPTVSEINIQSDFSTNTQILVFDLTGKLVLTRNVDLGNNLVKLDVRELKTGSYLLMVKDEKGVNCKVVEVAR